MESMKQSDESGKRWLKLRLKGCLQSYSKSPYEASRDTEDLPTKSAVIGMAGSALGLMRGNQKLEELYDDLEVYIQNVKDGLWTYGDHMVDYCTVVKPDGVKIMNAAGKMVDVKFKPVTKEYLVNADFTVFLYGEEKLINELKDAFQKPLRPLFLGRKCCIPSRRILNPADCDEIPAMETLVERL